MLEFLNLHHRCDLQLAKDILKDKYIEMEIITMRMFLKSKQAFTLVEIMIAVGVIILLFALSIHGLLRARVTANETAAIKSLRTIYSVFTSYRTVNPRYPQVWVELSKAKPPYLDNKWVQDSPIESMRQGYKFIIKPNSNEDEWPYKFFLIAQPEEQGVTGMRTFFLAEDGEIVDSEGVGLGSAGLPE